MDSNVDIEPSSSKDKRDQPAYAPSRISFPIVGIGASAGGLEAISELFVALLPDCGMAFLLVQHLDPGHASMLAEILAQKTSMDVAEATEGQIVERNRVYVIPPNTSMTIMNGRLTLKPRNDTLGPPRPIDDLFHSLAEEQDCNAIGVCLSGSGSDGALGMQAIKGAGGITFAQDNATAKFSSMPQAAIALGCIDFVLPPRKISEELMRIRQHPFIATQPLLNGEHLAANDLNLKVIFHLLSQVCNIDFAHYKHGTVARRLARRMALLNLNSLPAYVAFLEQNPEAIRALCQDLLIRVTKFFRDPETFAYLAKDVFSGLMRERPSTAPLRIWVPGCSSGEEVYSIAMCLLECLGDRAAQVKIQIFGTDVCEPALAIARAGIYVENICREVSEERLARFFIKINGHYQIAKSVRDLCVFARQNVTCDPPFSQIDLISCRNLLIYFDSTLQKQTISLFYYALNAGGFLVLGPSESISASPNFFTLTDRKKFKIYTKKSLRPQSRLSYLGEVGVRKSAAAAPHMMPSAITSEDRQKGEFDRIALARFVPPGVLCDENLNVLEFRGDTGPYLVQPPGQPSANLRQLARAGLLAEISSMIKQARKEAIPVRRTAVRVDTPTGIKDVSLEATPIIPTGDAESSRFVIFFGECTLPVMPKSRHRARDWWTMLPGGNRRREHANRHDHQLEALHLRRELDVTREHIRAIYEEHEGAQADLKASQEELLSSNEEFQSTNEELETAKEELQSSNEELITMNDELLHRNDELNQLNAALKQERDYSDAIVETVPDPMLVLDENLRVVRANAAFYSCFRLTPSETENCQFYELDHRQWDIPVLHRLLGEILPVHCFFNDHELTSVFPALGARTMLLNGKHLALTGRSFILLVIRDITERRAMDDALKEMDQRKDEFLAMLAHELRNPLTPIRNSLEVWQRGDAGDAAEKQAQVVLDRQLRKETRLVDDLLDIARITSGKIALKGEAVDLVQIVNEAVEATQHLSEARHQQLKLVLPKQDMVVAGDAIRLEQIISNLLSNAAKYTQVGGCISVTLESKGGKAILSVVDNGIGIAAELLPRVFDLFVQANVSSDRSQGGLGVGLTLARRLIELHGGTIQATSEGPKKGSTFVINLPIIAETSLRAANGIKTAVAHTPRRILVVDDNVDSAESSALLLQLEGHDVRAVYDGPAAIETAQGFKPEIVLLDIGLPGMNGYEVAQCLRRAPETSEILLIALSGYGQVDDLRRSREAGFDHHLVKPTNTAQLRDLIAKLGS